MRGSLQARNNRIITRPNGANSSLKVWLSGAKSRTAGHPISAQGWPALYPYCSLEDVVMRNIDFSPLLRSSLGFDRLLERLEEAVRAPERDAGYLPTTSRESRRRLSPPIGVGWISLEELLTRVERDALIIARRKPLIRTENSPTRASLLDHSSGALSWLIS